MRKMGEKKIKNGQKMGTPKNCPFFKSQKMGNRKNKKKIGTQWEFSKKIKKSTLRKKIILEKKSKLVLQRKMWFQFFLPRGCPQKIRKKMGNKWALDHFRKMGALKKRKWSSAHFFSKRCPSSSLAY